MTDFFADPSGKTYYAGEHDTATTMAGSGGIGAEYGYMGRDGQEGIGFISSVAHKFENGINWLWLLSSVHKGAITFLVFGLALLLVSLYFFSEAGKHYRASRHFKDVRYSYMRSQEKNKKTLE